MNRIPKNRSVVPLQAVANLGRYVTLTIVIDQQKFIFHSHSQLMGSSTIFRCESNKIN